MEYVFNPIIEKADESLWAQGQPGQWSEIQASQGDLVSQKGCVWGRKLKQRYKDFVEEEE